MLFPTFRAREGAACCRSYQPMPISMVDFMVGFPLMLDHIYRKIRWLEILIRQTPFRQFPPISSILASQKLTEDSGLLTVPVARRLAPAHRLSELLWDSPWDSGAGGGSGQGGAGSRRHSRSARASPAQTAHRSVREAGPAGRLRRWRLPLPAGRPIGRASMGASASGLRSAPGYRPRQRAAGQSGASAGGGRAAATHRAARRRPAGRAGPRETRGHDVRGGVAAGPCDPRRRPQPKRERQRAVAVLARAICVSAHRETPCGADRPGRRSQGPHADLDRENRHGEEDKAKDQDDHRRGLGRRAWAAAPTRSRASRRRCRDAPSARNIMRRCPIATFRPSGVSWTPSTAWACWRCVSRS